MIIARVRGGRDGDKDGICEVKEENDGKLEYAARAAGA